MHEAGVRLNVLFGGGVGFAASGIFGSIGAYLTELFPSDVRANGQGLQLRPGHRRVVPSLAGYLGQTHGLAWAFGVFTTTAYGVVIIAALMLPETKGRIRE